MQVSYLQKSENNLKSVKNILSFCEFNKLFFDYPAKSQIKTNRKKGSYQKVTKSVNTLVFVVFLKKMLSIKAF